MAEKELRRVRSSNRRRTTCLFLLVVTLTLLGKVRGSLEQSTTLEASSDVQVAASLAEFATRWPEAHHLIEQALRLRGNKTIQTSEKNKGRKQEEATRSQIRRGLGTESLSARGSKLPTGAQGAANSIDAEALEAGIINFEKVLRDGNWTLFPTWQTVGNDTKKEFELGQRRLERRKETNGTKVTRRNPDYRTPSKRHCTSCCMYANGQHTTGRGVGG